MKTLGDVERWLRGPAKGYGMKLSMGLSGEMLATITPISNGQCFQGTSKISMESAIENAMEELRRHRNGQESARTEEKAMTISSLSPSPWAAAVAQAFGKSSSTTTTTATPPIPTPPAAPVAKSTWIYALSGAYTSCTICYCSWPTGTTPACLCP